MRAAIAWFANNHVAANLMLGLIVMAGLVGVTSMPQKSFPDIDVPVITVTVPYLGAAPEEVEEGVCVRIEEEVDGIEGIEKITSRSNEGICTVSIQLFEEADKAQALDDVKNRVDSIVTFPGETEKPIINLVTPIRPVLDIAITGPQQERTLKVLGQQVRDDIAKLPGVTQVELKNIRPYEISIEVSEEALRRNNLTFAQVARTVRNNSLDLPGGTIKTSGGEILLRTKGQAYWGPEFGDIVLLTRPDGTRLYMRDVADVVDGFEDTDQKLRFDGKPAAIIRVSRVGSQDIMEITQTVQGYLATAGQSLPEGVELTVWNDGSKLLRDRLDTLLDSARQGFLMVLILLALFLRPRLAFWVSVGVPVAFLGALALANVIGLSIDAISLFGFILVLGILVDDAIVVGENVFSTQRREPDQLLGSIRGAQQVSIPVIFGVLTTISAFLPLLLAPGTFGQIFGVISTVVICCLIFSVIESQLILPAHLGHTRVESPSAEVGLMLVPLFGILLLEFSWSVQSYLGLAILVASLIFALQYIGLFPRFAGKLIELQGRFSAGLEHAIDTKFRALVEGATKYRYITIALAWAAFMSAVGIVGSGRLPFSFFPPLASDQSIAQLSMPLGTSAEITEDAVLHLERTAQELAAELAERYPDNPPVTHILSAVGSQPSTAGGGGPGGGGGAAAGGHTGEVTMQMIPSQERDLSSRQITAMWRERAGSIPEAIELKFSSSLFTVGNAIDIQLAGNDVDELRDVAAKIREKLAEYPGVIDITDSFRSGKQEIKLNILPAGQAVGLTLGDLAQQVRQAFYGEEVQRIQRGRDEVKVMVRYTEDERTTLATLDTMRIRTPSGAEVPFGTVAQASIGRGFSAINRVDRQRVVSVIADVDRSQITANEVIADLGAGPIQAIMRDHPRVSYSLEGEQAEQAEAVGSLIPMFGIAMFVVYALLAVPLRSYSQPLIIMSVIPFAFVGAIWGHWIMQQLGLISGLAMMSVMRFIAASGVVINSSLVLVHKVNEMRANGESMDEAVEHAAVSRCRPIVLTSMTTFVGLLPLMLNTSVQAQFLVPMAVSLAFGVLFSTVVTLLVVPSGYKMMHDFADWMGRDVDAPHGEQKGAAAH